MKTILLLVASNAFMTMAWYGHLKFPRHHLALTILVSWLIALPEYALQVPANRVGHQEYGYSPTALKVIQEVISLSVFAVFAFFYFREVPGWRQLAAFALIVAASALILPSAITQPHAPPPAEKVESQE
jgi:uncharacterized protein (DUF486 family)